MKKISIIFAALFLLAAFGNRAQAQCTDGTDCYLVIQGYDDYGDGWNGNTLTFTQGGVTLRTFTLSNGSSATDTIRLCSADGPVLCLFNQGSFSYEVSFTIKDSLGAELYVANLGSMSNVSGLFASLVPCPTCPNPANLTVSNLTSTSAVVSWTETGTAMQWYYTYGTSPVCDSNWRFASATTVELDELNDNTPYYFFVYAYCGGDDSSIVSSVSFRTECGLATLPLVENFENNGSSIPFCWKVFEQCVYSPYGYPTIYPYVYMDYYGSQGGTLYMQTDVTQAASVMSPKIPIPANEVEVMLSMAGEDVVQVGYVTTDDTANAEFHLVGVAGPTTSDDGYYYEWDQFVVSFDTVTYPDSIWVVLRRAPSVSSSVVQVDDVIIRQIVDCSLPTNLAVVGGTPVSGQVGLSWSDAAGSQWQVAYGPQGFDPDNANAAYVSSTATTTTVTGLDDHVLYDFYVRAVCGTTNGYWAGPVSAKPNVYTLPDNSASLTLTTCSQNIYHGLYGSGVTQTIVLEPADDEHSIHLTGSALFYSYSSAGHNKLRIFAGSDTTGLLLYALDNDEAYNIDVTSEVGPMTIWLSGITGNDSYYPYPEGVEFYVSCVDRAACTTPYGLTVSNVTGTTADVSWGFDTSLGEAEGFTLYVIDAVSGMVVNEENVSGSERSYTLTGLDERTAYRVRLALDCDGVDTIEGSFVTSCTVGGNLQVGTGTTTSSYLPTYLYYGNSLSQQLFLASEITKPQIFGFRYYQTTSSVVTDRQVEVYMDTTSLESYSDFSDYVAPTAEKRVFSGTVHTGQGWVEVSFDTPFTVPDGKNVVLTFNDRTNSFVSSAYNRITPTTASMAMYAYRDNTMFDATDSVVMTSASSHTLCSFRNTIVFLVSCDETNCAPPIGLTATPDTHSVSLAWTESSTAAAYQVEYREADSTNWTMASSSVSATEYTVTGLSANTEYVFRVSSICSDTAIGTIVSATTLCGAYALPFTETFMDFTADSYTEGIESCWYRRSDATYSQYPYVDTWDGYDDWYSMYFGGYNSTLVLPKMDAPVNNLSVEYYAYSGGVGARMEVGVCTDPADTNTYIPVDTYAYLSTEEDGWENVFLYLDNYNGPDGHIYFRTHTSDYSSFNIDQIKVDLIPSCRRIGSARVENVAMTSIDLSIIDQYTHDGYTIKWSTTDDYNLAIDSMNVTGTTATIAGLTPGTAYYVWVAGRCGGELGEPYAMGVLATTCLPIAVTESNPYFTEFEASDAECMWQKTDASNVKWSMSAAGTSGPGAYSGNRMLRLADSRSGESMMVMPTFDFSGMNANAELSFFENVSNRYYSNTAWDTIDAPDVSLAVYYRLGESGPWTLVANIDNSANKVWRHRYVELPSSQGASLYQVAFKGNPNGNTYGINIDNLRVGAITTCLAPDDLAVTDITDRAAIVRWTGNGTASYKVQYRPRGSWNWNARTISGADTMLISPLDMSTDYEVRVCAVCGALEQSEYTDVVSFTTQFCIDRMDMDNWVSGQVDTVAVNGFGNLEKLYNYTEILVDSARLAGLSNINGMAFYADSTNNGMLLEHCKIYMGHTTQTSLNAFQFDTNFVQVYEGRLSFGATGARNVSFDTPFEWDGSSNVVVGVYVDNSSSYYSVGPIYLAGHKGTGNRVYQGYSISYNGLDLAYANYLPAGNKSSSTVAPDLTFFGCNPVCFEPVINRITTTASSITVDWYNENATVEVSIKLASQTVWDTPVTVSGEHRFTFNNLPGMTEFDIRLRRVCSIEDDDYSEWVEARAMTDTACSIPSEVSVPMVGAHSATVSWTDGVMHGNKWEIHVWNSDVSLYYDVTSNPATITGLASGSSYRVAVRAYCGSSDHVVGEWSDAVIFENTCHPATNVQVSVTGNDVHVTWTAGERNQQWIVSYGYAGFDLNDQLGYVVVNTNSATFPGLGSASSAMKNNDGGNYGFRVRAICGDDWNSGWSSEVTTGSVGIGETDGTGVQFAIHPNPATEHVTLTMGDVDGEAEVTVLGVDGRLMQHFVTTASQLDFDVSSMAAGTYFVRVQTAEWTAVRKLIVK